MDLHEKLFKSLKCISFDSLSLNAIHSVFFISSANYAIGNGLAGNACPKECLL